MHFFCKRFCYFERLGIYINYFTNLSLPKQSKHFLFVGFHAGLVKGIYA